MRISDWSSDVCSSDLKIATDSEHGWQLVRRDAKRRPRRIVKIHLVDVAVRYGIVAIAIPFGIPARDAEGQLIVDERNGHRAFCQTHVVIADAQARITRKIAPWLRGGEVQRRSEERRGGKEEVNQWR